MSRLLICGSLVLTLLTYALWEKSQRLALDTQFTKAREQWAQAHVEARQQALDALRQMQRNYERQLRARIKARAAIEQARVKVITQIEESKENGPQDYRRWAIQPLPAVVINRLRQLPQERAAAGGHGLPKATP